MVIVYGAFLRLLINLILIMFFSCSAIKQHDQNTKL